MPAEKFHPSKTFRDPKYVAALAKAEAAADAKYNPKPPPAIEVLAWENGRPSAWREVQEEIT